MNNPLDLNLDLNLNSYLGQRNPSVKFLLLIFITFSVSFVFDIWRLLMLYGIGFCGFYYTTRFSLYQILKMQKPFLWVSLVILMVNFISRPGQTVLQFLFFNVTEEGIYIGVALALRTLFIGIISIAFLKTTCPVALMLSLNQHAKLNIKFSYAIMTGFCIVQRLSYDWQIILSAHKIRQKQRELNSLIQKTSAYCGQLKIYQTALLSVLVSAIRLCERIAFSLETKGLGLLPRTQVYSVPLVKNDYYFAVITLAGYFFIILGYY